MDQKTKPRRIIHVFQMLYVVQEHWKERNPRDKLLLVDLKKIQF
jgi:hypothetical protein